MKLFIISKCLTNIKKRSEIKTKTLIKSIEKLPIEQQVKIICKNI